MALRLRGIGGVAGPDDPLHPGVACSIVPKAFSSKSRPTLIIWPLRSNTVPGSPRRAPVSGSATRTGMMATARILSAAAPKRSFLFHQCKRCGTSPRSAHTPSRLWSLFFHASSTPRASIDLRPLSVRHRPRTIATASTRSRRHWPAIPGTGRTFTLQPLDVKAQFTSVGTAVRPRRSGDGLWTSAVHAPHAVLADGGVLVHTGSWTAVGHLGGPCFTACIDPVSGTVSGLAGARPGPYDASGAPQDVVWPGSRVLRVGSLRGAWTTRSLHLPFQAGAVGVIGDRLVVRGASRRPERASRRRAGFLRAVHAGPQQPPRPHWTMAAHLRRPHPPVNRGRQSRRCWFRCYRFRRCCHRTDSWSGRPGGRCLATRNRRRRTGWP